MEQSELDLTEFATAISKLEIHLGSAKEENKQLKEDILLLKIQKYELECALTETNKQLQSIQDKVNRREKFHMNNAKLYAKKEVDFKSIKHELKIMRHANEHLKTILQATESEKNDAINRTNFLQSQLISYQKQTIANNSIQESVSNVANFSESNQNQNEKDTSNTQHQQSQIITNKLTSTINDLKSLLDESIKEKTLIQEKCIQYQALSEHLQKCINMSNAQKIATFFCEKWQENLVKSDEMIKMLTACNNLREQQHVPANIK